MTSSFRSASPFCRLLAAAGLAVALMGLTPAGAIAGPFTELQGSWSGSGTISWSDGSVEPIRCKVKYLVESDGNKLSQDLRCASDSYKFLVKSTVDYKAAADVITGTWRESTSGTGGFVTGKVRNSQITARVKDPNFEADLGLTTTGDAQSVSIRPRGEATTIKDVSIKLARGG